MVVVVVLALVVVVVALVVDALVDVVVAALVGVVVAALVVAVALFVVAVDFRHFSLQTLLTWALSGKLCFRFLSKEGYYQSKI